MPVFNEENRIRSTLNKLNEWLNKNINKIDYELIIVDDGSIDNTCNIILEFKEKIDIKLLKNVHTGQFFSIIDGVKNSNFHYVVILEADLSAHPNYTLDFLNYMHDYDVVSGSRLLKKSKNFNKPIYRKVISNLYSTMFRFFFKTNITDPQISFKVYKKEVFLNAASSLVSEYDGMKSSEIILNILGMGYKIKEIPIEYFHSHSDRLVSIRNNLFSILWKNLKSFINVWISCKQKYRNKIFKINICRFNFFK